jgi:hypothetical protein
VAQTVSVLPAAGTEATEQCVEPREAGPQAQLHRARKDRAGLWWWWPGAGSQRSSAWRRSATSREELTLDPRQRVS